MCGLWQCISITFIINFSPLAKSHHNFFIIYHMFRLVGHCCHLRPHNPENALAFRFRSMLFFFCEVHSNNNGSSSCVILNGRGPKACSVAAKVVKMFLSACIGMFVFGGGGGVGGSGCDSGYFSKYINLALWHLSAVTAATVCTTVNFLWRIFFNCSNANVDVHI